MKTSSFCIAFLLGIGLLCAALGTAENQRDAASAQAEAEDNIREAVFRYRIAQLHAGSLIFLRVNGKDPSDTFMARFAEFNGTVKKASQSQVEKNGMPRLLDRKTKQPGMSFSAGDITWLATLRVEVHGGMYCGGLCADAGEYLLEKQQGRWTVIKYRVAMVS